MEPTLLEILRLGAYQLLYMDGVPDYAAVDEAVELARDAAGARSGGFVNAVLRRVGEDGDGPELFPAEDGDPLGYLSSWGSHPAWLVERWLARWDPPAVKRLVELDNTRPDVCLVPLESTPEAAAASLAEAGIDAEAVGQGTRCVRLGDPSSVRNALDVAGPAIVQDPAANLVSLYADVPPGTMVADLCAAPGGKALALPARSLRIVAADRSESRIQLLRDNARRTGRPMAVVVADALDPPVREAGAVLLDVPCTGTGTLSRHPDARWRLSPASVVEMAELQSRLLASSARVVAPGGLLVYSTCSLEREENEDRVDAFLDEHPHFALEPTAAVPGRLLDARGHLVVTPAEHGFDGSFAARMRRAS